MNDKHDKNSVCTTCVHCEALINEEVTYSDIIIKDELLGELYPPINVEISPCRCKNCGEFFDKIEIKPPRKIENKDY